VRDAHALSGKVKAIVKQAHTGIHNVLIHIEPDEQAVRLTGPTASNVAEPAAATLPPKFGAV